ncbi:hypothetical protein Tfer_2787 [Thermincola ferriacetica]|uniref:Uncharacterized protein n=1 Tax=Thermincola ferriacetica TaxID=281456 RepID=A0A0L6VZW9_9FIRM|nr:hypothetical protein [Thermincola ferriacetica]KNZ68693.1 hypothetical protein Tfer_2787 [Thermincola ferriacetica]
MLLLPLPGVVLPLAGLDQPELVVDLLLVLVDLLLVLVDLLLVLVDLLLVVDLLLLVDLLLDDLLLEDLLVVAAVADITADAVKSITTASVSAVVNLVLRKEPYLLSCFIYLKPALCPYQTTHPLPGVN